MPYDPSYERLRALEAWLSNLYKDAESEIRVRWDEYFKKHTEIVEKLLGRIREAGDDDALKKKATRAYLDYMKNHVVAEKYYKGMVREIARQYSEVNERALRMINGDRSAFFADGYNLAAGEINHVAIRDDIGIRFDLCSAEAVEWTAENRERNLMPPPERLKIPEDERWNAKLINSQVAQGIIQGESIPKIAARLENVTDGETKACIRRARTMATNCQNAGRVQNMKTAEEWGVQTRKRWMCTHDSRTRDNHLLLDGETIGSDEVFWNGCRWPGDHLGPPAEVWNCRCTLITVVDGFSSNLPKGKEGTVHVTFDGEELVQGGGAVAAAAETAPAAWGRVRELRSAKPAADMSSAELKEIGRAFYDSEEYRAAADAFSFDRDAAANYRAVVKEWNEAVAKLNKMKVNSAEDFAAWNAERERLRPLEEKLNLAKEAMERANEGAAAAKGEVSRLVAEARGEGRGFSTAEQQAAHLGRTTDARKAVAEAYGRYPESWVQASTDRSALSVKKVARGYYNDYKGELMISGDGNDGKNTAVHEIGHRMERVKGLIAAERRYYDERTAGESLKWIGPGYGRDEKTRKDQFISPYMGKDYGGTAFELVSMGMEGIIGFTNQVDLSQDEDMRDWITGILLAY